MNGMYLKRGLIPAFAILIFVSLLGCSVNLGGVNISLGPRSPTPTSTATRRPTLTPIPSPTDTPTSTNTATPAVTATSTQRPATPRPPTPRPLPTAAPKPPGPTQPPVSTFEFHANPPLACQHSGISYLKGTVYLNRSDPNSRYAGAIVALGPPNGSTIYDIVQTGYDGVYSFILGGNGEAKPGYWGIWLVDPSHNRKSDIGGPIVTNDLPAENPNSCWTSGIDFWK